MLHHLFKLLCRPYRVTEDFLKSYQGFSFLEYWLFTVTLQTNMYLCVAMCPETLHTQRENHILVFCSYGALSKVAETVVAPALLLCPVYLQEGGRKVRLLWATTRTWCLHKLNARVSTPRAKGARLSYPPTCMSSFTFPGFLVGKQRNVAVKAAYLRPRFHIADFQLCAQISLGEFQTPITPVTPKCLKCRFLV